MPYNRLFETESCPFYMKVSLLKIFPILNLKKVETLWFCVEML